MPKRRRLPAKTLRLESQIRRARKLARTAAGPVAELYLLHAEICEKKKRAAVRKDEATRVT